MASLNQRVAQVQRRLFLGSLLALAAWSWVAALAIAASWFLVQPYLLADAPDWLRWAVLGGLGGVSLLGSIIIAVLRAPGPVSAALSLDERFGLKERVTTSLTLAPDEAASPAGAALLADVESRLAHVRIGDRFPVSVPWKPAALLPLGALAVALIVFFWNPQLGAHASTGEEALAGSPETRSDVESQMKRLVVAKQRDKKPDERAKSPDLKMIEDEIDKFTRRPHQTREEVRDRIKDATALEDQIRREQKEQAARIDAFKEQMKQAERLRRKNRDKDQEGPAKKAQQALARADMDKTREEFQKLAKQMEQEEEKERLRRKKRDPKATEEERKKAEEELEKLERESKLSRKDKEDLQKQLQDMQDQLERLTRNKDEIAKELKDMEENGEIDKEELDRELEQLEKNAEKLSQEEIKELAEAIKQAKEALEKGEQGEAGEAMKKAAGAAGKMGKEGEGKEMAEKLVQIIKVKKALCKALGGNPAPGSGRRPESKDKGDTGIDEKQAPGDWTKGKMDVVGEGPVGGFKGPRKPSEMKEEIRQAAQEAPAAIDRQRLPPSARKMARGYFEKVRGPDKQTKDAPKKP